MSKLIAIDMLRANSIGLRCPDTNSQYYRQLKRSIKRQGLTTPLLVRSRTDWEGVNFYEIIDGHHRLQVLKEIGSEVAGCDILQADDLRVLILQLQLNLDKVTDEDLANGIKRIMTHSMMITLGMMAVDTTIRMSRIENVLGLNRLVSRIDLVRNGEICLANAYALAKLPPEEQPSWMGRAMCMKPDVFIPACCQKRKEIFNRRRRLVKEAPVFVPYHYFPNLVHDEVTLTFPNKAIVPMAADAGKIKDDIASMKTFMGGATKDTDDVIAMALASGEFDMSKMRPIGQRIGRMSGKGFIAPSGYELLHGKPKEPRISELKRTVTFTEKEPLVRKGWDHVKGIAHGEPWDYCSGDWLVACTGRCWTVNHPKKPKLSNLNFISAIEAMTWVEENFSGR